MRSSSSTYLARIAQSAMVVFIMAAFLPWRTSAQVPASSVEPAAQQEAASERTSRPVENKPLAYRLVFAESDPGEIVPRGYVPIKRSLLEQLLSVNQPPIPDGGRPLAVSEAHFLAILDGDVLRDGLVRLVITGGPPNGARDEEPSIVPLESWSLVTRGGFWLNGQGPVLLGADGSGRTYLRANGNGELLISWFERAISSVGGRRTFSMNIPQAPVVSFTLLIPADMDLQSELQTATTHTNRLPEWLPADQQAPYQAALSEGYVVTTFYASGKTRVQFAAARRAQAAPGWIALQQVRHVTLTPGIAELQEELRLDCWQQMLDHLDFIVPKELTLIEVTYAGQPLSWSVTSGDNGADHYRIDLTSPLSGLGHVVRATFQTDVVLRRTWRIPKVEIRGLTWVEGRMEIAVADTLEIKRIDYYDSHLVKRVSLPTAAEQWEFQCSSPNAACEVVLEPRAAPVHVEAGISLRLDRDMISARVVADYRVTWGEVFRLRVRVADPWAVDRVEVQPASVLDAAGTPWRSEGGFLDIPLLEPLSPDRPVRLILACRAPGPRRRTGLSGSALRVVEFQEVKSTDTVYALEAVPPIRLGLADDATLIRLDKDQLAKPWHSRLSEAKEAMWVKVDTAPNVALLRIEEPPGFGAETTIGVDVSADQIIERYTVRCFPESAGVSQIRVRLSPQRDVPLLWKLEGTQQPLVARLVQETTGDDDHTDIWEIDLPEAQSAPFTLQAERLLPAALPVDVALASVTNALSETGRILVQGLVPVHCEGERVEAVPWPYGAADASRVQAVFRYTPAQRSRLRIQPAGAMAREMLILSHRLTTYGYPTGTFVYDCQLLVQHGIQGSLPVTFPQAVRIESLKVNGLPREVPQTAQQLDIPLPADHYWSHVELRYATTSTSWQGVTSVDLIVPQFQTRALQQNWVAYFPREFVPLVGSTRASTSGTAELLLRITGGWLRLRQKESQAPTFANGVEDVERFLAWLNELTTGCGSWTEVAQRYAEQASGTLGWDCRVDAFALRHLLTLDWPAADAPTDAVESARRLLQKSGLVVLLYGRTALFTTPEGKLQYAAYVEDASPVARARSNPWLAEQLSPEQGTSELIWPLSSLRHGRLPARLVAFPGARDATPELGWDGWLLDTTATSKRLWIVHRNSLQAGGVAAFLLWLAVSLWIGSRRLFVLPVLGAMALAAAVLVPPPWELLGQASAAGVALGWLAAGLGRQRHLRQIAPRAAALCVLLAVGLSATGLLLGQMPVGREPGRSQQTILDVIIPFDSRTGARSEYVYVPRSLQAPLMNAVSRTPLAWLIVGAQHSLQGGSSGGLTNPDVLELVSRLRVWTASPNQVVELAYERTSGQLVQLLVDRQPADARWNSDGQRMLVSIASAGEHLVELRWAFRWPPEGTRWEFPIPPCPVTELAWEARTWTGWQLLGTQGRLVSMDVQQREELPGVDRISLVKTPMPVQNQIPSVQQLMWLRVQPGSVVVDVTWLFEPEAELPAGLIVDVDPRLRLLNRGSGDVAPEPQTSQDAARIVVPTGSLAASSYRLHASFLISGSNGLGQLILPFLKPANAKVTQLWMAISASAELELDLGEDANRVATEAFERLWGLEKQRPLAVLELERFMAKEPPQVTWPSIAVRWKAESLEYDEATEIGVFADQLRVNWQASVSSLGPATLVRRIEVPVGLENPRVTVVQGGQEIPVRSIVGPGGMLTVLSEVPLQGTYVISLEGRVRLGGALIDCPAFTLYDARRVKSLLRVTRHPTVASVELENLQGWQPEEVPQDDPADFLAGRVVGAWRSGPDATTLSRPRLRIIANQLEAAGFLATRLVREQAGWWVELEYHVRVTRGALDLVRLELPADWVTSFEVSPDRDFQVQTLPQESRQLLIVRPSAPVTDRYQLRVRGRLEISGDGVRRVPEVMPLDVQRVQRFVVLPARLNAQVLAWSTSGLQERNLPPFFQFSTDASATWQTFAVIGARFRASLHHVERVPGPARVRLADVHLAYQAPGRWAGVAAFDIEPNGLSTLELVVPSTTRIVKLFLDGVSVVPLDSAQADLWRIRLSPPQLLQRLEVAFHCDAPTAGSRETLFLPYPRGLTVERTFWTLDVPRQLRVSAAVPAGSLDQASQVLWQRWRALVEELENGMEVAVEIGGSEAQDWLAIWAPRVRVAERELLASLELDAHSANPSTAQFAAEVRRQVDTWTRKWPQLLQQWNLPSDKDTVQDELELTRVVAQWQWLPQASMRRAQWGITGECFRLEVDLQKALTPGSGRWYYAGLILLTGVLLSFLGRYPWNRIARGATVDVHLLLGLAGVLATVFVEPAIFGLTLIVVAVGMKWAGHWSWKRPAW